MATRGKYAWENGPFKLMQTPAARDPERKTDPHVNFATLMALIHNSWMRAFNAIYVAAPHTPQNEYASFVGYALQVHAAVKAHHDEEEAFVFPLIESMTGVKGLMQENVEQHRAFETGFEAFASYLSSLISTRDTSSFSGNRLREIIDSFSEPLQKHLDDEIQTLLDLQKYPEVDITAMQKKAEEETLSHMTLAQLRDNLPVVMLNHDQTFEGSMHGKFPPLPGPMSLIIRRVVTCWNWSWWKFAACDVSQMPKELPYVDTSADQ